MFSLFDLLFTNRIVHKLTEQGIIPLGNIFMSVVELNMATSFCCALILLSKKSLQKN